jgi:hypothetical protein
MAASAPLSGSAGNAANAVLSEFGYKLASSSPGLRILLRLLQSALLQAFGARLPLKQAS